MRYSIPLLALMLAACQNNSGAQPIIDMHRHAPLASAPGAGTEQSDMLTEFSEHNVVLSVVSMTSPQQLENWTAEGSDTIINAAMMPCPRNLAEPWYDCFPETSGLPDIDWLRAQIQSGAIGALHEMMFNYDGSLPDDEKMEPYWALAAEHKIPVGVHSWSGPPPGQSIRRNSNCCPNYNGDIGNPKNLRPVLEKYPDLKIWIQHVGSDGDEIPALWDETLALLRDYPNVYVDLSITNSVLPIEYYNMALTRLIENGFGNRIMFGSDNLPIELVVGRLNSIEDISQAQRDAILYDNAADFLGLSPKIRRKHRLQ